jgi:hypothetical protein
MHCSGGGMQSSLPVAAAVDNRIPGSSGVHTLAFSPVRRVLPVGRVCFTQYLPGGNTTSLWVWMLYGLYGRSRRAMASSILVFPLVRQSGGRTKHHKNQDGKELGHKNLPRLIPMRIHRTCYSSTFLHFWQESGRALPSLSNKPFFRRVEALLSVSFLLCPQRNLRQSPSLVLAMLVSRSPCVRVNVVMT